MILFACNDLHVRINGSVVVYVDVTGVWLADLDICYSSSIQNIVNLPQVAAKQMVGLYLSVWVTKTILPQIRGVQVTAVGTGVMGFLGNKGDVRHTCCPALGLGYGMEVLNEGKVKNTCGMLNQIFLQVRSLCACVYLTPVWS